MNCPTINDVQSRLKGQKRFDNAIENLGQDVVKRILGFSLYTLGYSYETIMQKTDMSEAGLKLVVKELYESGVERFIDKRKKESYPVFPKVSKQEVAAPKGLIKDDADFIEFNSTGPVSLKIRKDDDLGKKIMTLLFCDSGLINQKEAASILGCQRQAVHRNQKKLKSDGVKGLYDNRVGQKKDYKYESNIKSELIKQFFLTILEDIIPSKSSVTSRLNVGESQSYSERSIAHHLKQLGLTDNKEKIYREIAKAVNQKIDDLAYLSRHHEIELEAEQYVDILKTIKQELVDICHDFDNDIFRSEIRIEAFQSKLQALMMESLLKSVHSKVDTCPFCQSPDITIWIRKRKPNKVLTTSMGGGFDVPNEAMMKGTCHACQREFDLISDILELPDTFNYTPLTQKKICSANRAGSYENAVKNLRELINLDINRSQVRNISTMIGEYIYEEFKQLYVDISNGLPASSISERHPLVAQLSLDKKYLDRSNYLIVLALDGGRMQLCDWIPSESENGKAKKHLHWHECKVFRVSVYDKSARTDMTKAMKDAAGTGVYKSAMIIPGLTTYGATNSSWKDTAWLIQSHLYMRGIGLEDIELCISDGSEHIQNDVLIPLFPDVPHILDYYHKAEALYKCTNIIGRQGTKTQERLKQYLWDGKINELIQELRDMQSLVGFPEQGKRRKSDDPKIIYDNFINHLEKNKSRIKYDEFRERSYPIGSGCIESAVKLFSKRIKGTEKQWSDEGGEAILHLYSFLLSEDNRWDLLWQYHRPWK
jgi:transposase